MFHSRTPLAIAALTFVIGALACGAAAAPPPTLENLLQELETLQEPGFPPESTPGIGAMQDKLNKLVMERDVVARRNGGFFPLLTKTSEHYLAVQQASIHLAQSQVFRARAQAEFVQQQQMSKGGREALGLANAQAQLQRAQVQEREAESRLSNAGRVLTDHLATVREQGGAFFRVYHGLRSCLPHRKDELNEAIAKVLSESRGRSPDFIEADILAAIAFAYDGRTVDATARLEDANQVLKRYPVLLSTMLAEDCCAAWLLLHRPDQVGPYIGIIEKTRIELRTPSQQWLAAAYTAMREGPADALKKYKLAFTKAKAQAPPALKAEIAVATLEGLKGPRALEKAKDYLEGVTAESDWSVLRAQAAIAAAEEEWENAVRLIEEAKQFSPACMDDVLEQQRVAYEKGEPWTSKPSR